MSELSKSELDDFLAEINSEEAIELPAQETQEAHERKPRKHYKKSADGMLVECTEEEWLEMRKKSAATRSKNTYNRNVKRREIIKEALNSDYVDLNSPISVENKKLLIEKLVKKNSAIMKGEETYINNLFTRHMGYLIPKDLLNAWKNYKDCMVPAPSFTYTASEEYGQGLSFKVNVNLPMYFSSEACTTFIDEHYPDLRPKIDRAVTVFYKHKDERNKLEIRCAQMLTKVATYYQLLKLNPIWYDTLIKAMKEKYGEHTLRYRTDI